MKRERVKMIDTKREEKDKIGMCVRKCDCD